MALDRTTRQDIGPNEQGKTGPLGQQNHDIINASYSGRYPQRVSILMTRSESNSNLRENATNQSLYQVV